MGCEPAVVRGTRHSITLNYALPILAATNVHALHVFMFGMFFCAGT